MTVRSSLVILLLAIGVAVALLGNPSKAQAKACGDVSAAGKTWIVGGGGVGCGFQRKWAVRYINDRQAPTGWKCHFRGGSGGCDKRGSDAFFIFYPPD